MQYTKIIYLEKIAGGASAFRLSLFHLPQTAQTPFLVYTRFYIFPTADAYQDYRLVRFFYPFAVLVIIFRHSKKRIIR
ncbi:hypothetical protein C4556_02830 [Candidatus Parcubacteria bacterium]|nr:MAG: hypothetical protein C4556_02830 [Candidatus Parcubacteria bacterium]